MPYKLKLYIQLANLTRELRMALLTYDWSSIQQLCTSYETLTAAELNDITKIDAPSNHSDGSTDGSNMMSNILTTIQPTVQEFVFARAASHHHNIVTALNKALSSGGPVGDVGQMDTSTIRKTCGTAVVLVCGLVCGLVFLIRLTLDTSFDLVFLFSSNNDV